jgi:hypothetical protein
MQRACAVYIRFLRFGPRREGFALIFVLLMLWVYDTWAVSTPFFSMFTTYGIFFGPNSQP